jgi:hypothetical protein
MSQSLSKTFAELERDLIPDGGPRISTMRNYRFCIVVYPPEKEFSLRREVQKLNDNLEQAGWVVKTISLQQLLFARLRRLEGGIEWLIDREKAVSGPQPPARAERARTEAHPRAGGPRGDRPGRRA